MFLFWFVGPTSYKFNQFFDEPFSIQELRFHLTKDSVKLKLCWEIHYTPSFWVKSIIVVPGQYDLISPSINLLHIVGKIISCWSTFPSYTWSTNAPFSIFRGPNFVMTSAISSRILFFSSKDHLIIIEKLILGWSIFLYNHGLNTDRLIFRGSKCCNDVIIIRKVQRFSSRINLLDIIGIINSPWLTFVHMV